MTRLWRILLVAIVMMAASPTLRAVASTPPSSPPVTNDLLPDNNNLNDCIGTAEPANCGSRSRADGHTYLVFLALAAGLAFIGWRIARGVRSRDRAHDPTP